MKKRLILFASILGFAIILAATQIPAEPVTADMASVSVDADFQLNGTTLVKYTGTAKTVSVPASVTTIAEEAFANNTTMETLSFKGDQVGNIAYRAFAGCTGLKEVSLPDSVTEIGNGAFSNCTSLETVTFGESMSKLGLGAFAGCENLSQIKVDKDNKNFLTDDGCLYNADKTKLYLMLPGRTQESYTMPSTVTDIAEYAFWGCENMKNISLGSNLKTIPDYSFTNCRSLESLTIPYSVQSIGLKAFADCGNLQKVTIPSTVSDIHDTAFDGCKNLVIAADEGSAAYQYYQAWKERNAAEKESVFDTEIVPDDNNSQQTEHVQTEPSTPSSPQAAEESRDVMGSTYVVANQAVVFIDNSDWNGQHNSQGSAGTGPNGTGTDEATDQSTGVPEESMGEADNLYVSPIPKSTVAFDKILADQAYYNNKNMAEYKIPDGITEIGEFTFARSNLVEADIPKGVKTIGYGAFYHCDLLREVDIPFSVTYIAPKAFAESMWLDNWLAGSGEDYLVVGDGILLAYRGNGGKLVLPDTVRRIAPEVFAGNDTIVSVEIPDSVIDIGEGAFCGCKNLKTITGGSNVQTIRDRAFMGCALETAHVWEKVTQLGLCSFDFSGTTFGISGKVVVFDNKEALPAASCEETAGRLSNDAARGFLLGDTAVVIVDKGIRAEELKDTILGADANGFQGIIACISSKDKGIVTCLATTYSQEEFKNAYIPEYITIDQKSYQVTGKENITVFGEEKDYPAGSITVDNGSLMFADISAELTQNEGSYRLSVSDCGTGTLGYVNMNKAYEWVYGETLPQSTLCVDMTLTDSVSKVPVQKFGREMLRVTLALPANMAGWKFKVYTIDRNGQLESLPYSSNGDTVTVETSHLSPIAFVRVN